MPVLRQWRESEGLGLAVYSSGSVFAQKLLFGHVREGDGRVRDLTGWFGGFWDTGIGGKLEVESYGRITAGLEVCGFFFSCLFFFFGFDGMGIS